MGDEPTVHENRVPKTLIAQSAMRYFEPPADVAITLEVQHELMPGILRFVATTASLFSTAVILQHMSSITVEDIGSARFLGQVIAKLLSKAGYAATTYIHLLPHRHRPR